MNVSSALIESMKTHWSIRNYAECIRSLGDMAFPSDGGLYCNATWDTIVCWPSARAGSTVTLPCPPIPGLDTSKLSYRTCGLDGRWEGRFPGDTSMPMGYTNYTDCYTPEAYDLYRKYLLNKTPAQKQMLKDAISGTRTMDVVGLMLSLVSSLISLFIFSYFRSLRCHRTRIHRNLFVAIIVQVSIRIIVYVDQFVARLQGGEIAGSPRGMSGAIYDTPVLCEILYILLEYTKTVQFMWMLIEGLYLHNQIAVSVFSKRPNYFVFYIMGWCSPIPVTLAWALAMTHYQMKSKCWMPYYSVKLIWIIETPRIAVIVINLLFLLNIIRVLVLKLQDSHRNEAQIVKVRKAIKAVLFLLPLLGITNFVVMIDPLSDSLKFAIWSYSSHSSRPSRESYSVYKEPAVSKLSYHFFRKAIKAALFLLPLLGITNFVVMIDPPSDSLKFAIWSYSSHFLGTFYGISICLHVSNGDLTFIPLFFRKAIKAALFLLPLLGITNFVVMIDPPSDSLKFAIWSYSSHFLVSFQGFFISLLYCFLNGELQMERQQHEKSNYFPTVPHTDDKIRLYKTDNGCLYKEIEVQATLKKRWNRFRQSRMVHSSSLRRMSRSFSVFTSLTDVPKPNLQTRGQLPPIYNGNTAPLLRDIMSRQDSCL